MRTFVREDASRPPRTVPSGSSTAAIPAALDEQLQFNAAESERARLSRELHDGPLHSIAAVIRRLERRPDTEAEQRALRDVAASLRLIATGLHPPALDDFGLASALEGFARDDQVPSVVVCVGTHGCARTDRPPEDVEIAAYRVVQEALANAVTHSGTSVVTIRGHVSADSVALAVIDDGAGFRGHDLEVAMRAGHLGVASMRRRAEAVDAHLDVRSVVGIGTTVMLDWPA
jgi:signal transduction histidine kinase